MLCQKYIDMQYMVSNNAILGGGSLPASVNKVYREGVVMKTDQVLSKIIKRNGNEEDFRSSKIVIAITKAGEATGEFSYSTAQKLTLKVLSLAYQTCADRYPTVEEIQDILADFIAMDIKTPLYKYGLLTSQKNCAQNIRESIAAILGARVDHQFRTTLVRPFTEEEDFPEMAALIKGAQSYQLQRFIPRSTILDPHLLQNEKANFLEQDIVSLQKIWGMGGN